MKRVLILFCIASVAVANASNYHAKGDSLATKYSSNGLDSVVTHNADGKTVKKIESYSFNNNRLVSCVETVGNIVTKYNYGYDECGNQTLYEISKFDKDQNAYSLKYKEEWAYQNNSGCATSLLISHACEGVPESETAYKSEKNNYVYSNGNIQKLTKEDVSGNIVQEISYTYNPDGRTEAILSKNRENYQLTPTAKIAYTYFSVSENINHFKTETIYRYNSNSNEVVCMKTTYDPSKYAAEKLFISTVEYFDTLGVCINKEVRTSKYSDNLDEMQESQVEIFEKDNTSAAATIQYDDKGDVISSEASAQNSAWKGEWRYEEHGGVDTYYLKSSETNATLWSMSVYYIYTVTQIPTVNPSMDLGKFKFAIFPNPVKDDLFIEYSTNGDIVPATVSYSIYNLTGKLQLHGAIHAVKEAIPVQSLSPGSYIISFIAGGYQGTSVFIKN